MNKNNFFIILRIAHRVKKTLLKPKEALRISGICHVDVQHSRKHTALLKPFLLSHLLSFEFLPIFLPPARRRVGYRPSAFFIAVSAAS